MLNRIRSERPKVYLFSGLRRYCTVASRSLRTLIGAAIVRTYSCGCRSGRKRRARIGPNCFKNTSERGAPFTTAGLARVIERSGKVAKLTFKAHPLMLRHACGYALANTGHDTRALQAYLGDAISSTRFPYTELSPTRLKDFWRE